MPNSRPTPPVNRPPGGVEEGMSITVLTGLMAKLFRLPVVYVSLIDETGQWVQIGHGWTPDPANEGRDPISAQILVRKQALLVEDTWNDGRFASHPLVQGEPFVRFLAGYPLFGLDRHPIGTLCLIDRVPRQFSARDREIIAICIGLCERELRLRGTLSSQAQLLALHRDLLRTQEQLHFELREAGRYVESILPPPAHDAEWKVDWIYEPSQMLGGDAFYYSKTDGQMRFGIFDVSGHGVGAAMLSVSLLNLIRNRATVLGEGRRTTPTSALLRELAVSFPMEQNRDMYFTAWIGFFDPATRLLRFCNAGHPPPLAFADEAGWREGRELFQRQFPIGFDADFPYEETSVELPPGTTLFLYSDGAYEVMTETGAELDYEWFQRRLRHMWEHQESLERYLPSLTRHTGRVHFEDDVTLLRITF